jgi:hypothetical protein
MTSYVSNKVPDWQPAKDKHRCHCSLVNKVTDRRTSEVAIRIARTLIRYYSDKEDLNRKWVLEHEACMKENMAAWESLMDDYDGLVSMDD